jgi:RNA polymerase sigma-70 factor (ECF subfamily)
MQETALTDRSLVLRVRSGDETAATALYHRYAGRVFGLVQKQMAEHLKSQVEPEDVVQSIFRSVFRGVNSAGYDAPAGGTLWHLIAVLAVHKVRKNGRRRSAAKRDSRRTESFEIAGQAEQAAASPEEIEVAIRELVETLTPEEQEVVRLRVQSFTVEEIAERLNKSRRTTERLLQSARTELAKLL